jgi:hypothetical protein
MMVQQAVGRDGKLIWKKGQDKKSYIEGHRNRRRL